MKKYLIIFLMFLIFTGCSQNAVKEDNRTKDNTTKNSNPVVNEQKNNIGDVSGKKEITQDEIKSIYSKLTLNITNKKTNKSFEVEVPVGEKTSIDSTNLEVEVVAYYPDFVMDEAKGAVTKSLEERNPTAKVNIYKDGKIVFKGWLFANFPDIHAFEDSDYDVKLITKSKEK
jgi:hypothetical protein